MGITRRGFMGGVGAAAGAGLGMGWGGSLEAALASFEGASPEAVAADEDFWSVIQEAYTVDRGLINLNNGGVSPSPRIVQEAHVRYQAQSNEAPSYTMWRLLEPRKELVRQKLGRLAGTDPEQIAITRNATESLDTVIFGLDLEPGDEIVSTTQDYPRMVNAWRQREQRDGVVFRQVTLPMPCEDSGPIVDAFREAITERTKVLHFCHVINLTGAILPVREIAALAEGRDIQVIVDGAHSFGHFEFDIPSLGGDYFGTSLHKWLCAPFGTGLLWMKKERIAPLWPLLAHTEAHSEDIRKFEQTGTYPVPIPLAIGEAVEFHERIGSARKEARLRYLRDYWVERLRDLPGFRLHTSLDPERSCGIATFELEGIAPNDLNRKLLQDHKIVLTGIDHEDFRGTRVSPHVYTSPRELDIFVDAVRRVAENGI
ncbi:MAG: aminotransferase class V-fold PLP-dependent enzyme [Planctomycetota bacterium]